MTNSTWDPVKQTGMSPARAALASVHPRTTLPGHDASKVRDCITASASEALDVRVFQVAEWLAMRERWAVSEEAAKCYAAHAETLRAIAAEIRDEATPSSPRTTRACRESITDANTEAALARAWRDVAPSLPTLTTAERLAIAEAFITRLCVVTQDDGR